MLDVYTLASILAPNPVKQVFKYTNNDLQRATKLGLKPFRQGQEQAQLLLDLRKRSLKTRFLDLFKRKLHMDCYHFLRQCENHFNTAKAIGKNCTPFAALFFCKSISIQWT